MGPRPFYTRIIGIKKDRDMRPGRASTRSARLLVRRRPEDEIRDVGPWWSRVLRLRGRPRLSQRRLPRPFLLLLLPEGWRDSICFCGGLVFRYAWLSCFFFLPLASSLRRLLCDFLFFVRFHLDPVEFLPRRRLEVVHVPIRSSYAVVRHVTVESFQLVDDRHTDAS